MITLTFLFLGAEKSGEVLNSLGHATDNLRIAQSKHQQRGKVWPRYQIQNIKRINLKETNYI
jgi:hypothetical protein